jgi:hypothetical protein
MVNIEVRDCATVLVALATTYPWTAWRTCVF